MFALSVYFDTFTNSTYIHILFVLEAYGNINRECPHSSAWYVYNKSREGERERERE